MPCCRSVTTIMVGFKYAFFIVLYGLIVFLSTDFLDLQDSPLSPLSP